MEAQLKQRIVGAIVIACVLAIFLPVLLHKPKPAITQTMSMTIPKPEPVSQMSMQLAKRSSEPQAVANVEPVQATAAHSQEGEDLPATSKTIVIPHAQQVKPKSQPIAHKAKKKAVVAHHVHDQYNAHKSAVQRHKQINTKILDAAVATPQAWVVQLASFADTKNARNLVGRLRKAGFEAYLRTSHTPGRSITRVFVGPEIKQHDIQHIKSRLSKKFHLHGVVRRYHV